VAIQWSCFEVDDDNHFGAFDSMVVGARSDPEHRSGVYRHPAAGFQPKPLLPFAVELMPLGSQALTHGIWKDKPIEHTRQTGGIFGDAAFGRMVGNRGGTAGGSF